MALAAALAAGAGATVARAQGECAANLLANDGFEQGFSGRGRLAETVGVGWNAWYERFPGTGGINYVPDYAPVQRLAGLPPEGVAEGMWAQEMSTTDATHTAGLWQRVDVPGESLVSVRVLVYAWASDGEDPGRSEPPGTYVSTLGLDPEGGTDPDGPTVQWTAPISVTDAWVPLSLEAPVPGGAATVFLRGRPLRPLRHNVSRWDAACLRVLGPAQGPVATAADGPWSGAPADPGTRVEPSATSDPATQMALDVALYVEQAATAQAATAQAATAQAATAQAATAQAAARAGSGVEGAGRTATGVLPEGGLPPGGSLDGAAATVPAASWPGAGGLAGDGAGVALGPSGDLGAALADRAGMLFLGLAAVIAGAWLGLSRRGRADGGGES